MNDKGNWNIYRGCVISEKYLNCDWTRYSELLLLMVFMRFLESNSAVCAGVSTGLVQVDEDFRVSKGASTSVASSYPGVREADRFILDHLHCAQRIRLKLHSCLLKPRAGVNIWPGPLAGGPRLGRIGSLRKICNCRLDGV